MSSLERVASPAALRALTRRQVDELAAEIRAFLVSNVSRTGGHLGPNLGVVELTLALHRVFDSPDDPIIFDTGHQSYVHKLVTGRRDLFPTLRQAGGMSGYPSRAESPHDWVENSHASASLSWAEGLAKAFQLRGERRTVVAVIGDGALTGGMAWEALNNIAAQEDLPLVVVVNDNGRSYTPTVGGLANQLSALRTDRRYEQLLAVVKRTVSATPLVGRHAYDLLHGLKTGIKDVLAPQGLFSDLGMKYVGPIDGHDVAAVERGLTLAKHFGGPVIVHCLTTKGRGFKAAEDHDEDHFHSVGRINELTGEPLSAQVAATWTDVFAEEIVQLPPRTTHRRHHAAMLHPTGLGRFQATYRPGPSTWGIAEQHALASAAGLAAGGLHPVVALRHLPQPGVRPGADGRRPAPGRRDHRARSGRGHRTGRPQPPRDVGPGPDVPGPGSPTAAPRDATRLRQALATAVKVDDAPPWCGTRRNSCRTTSRGSNRRRCRRAHHAGAAVRRRPGRPWCRWRSTSPPGWAAKGIGVTVVDPVWALPINPALVGLARPHDLVVTLEDGLASTGVGAKLAVALEAAGVRVPVRQFGISDRFLPQGTRAQVLEGDALTAQDVARTVTEVLLSAEAHGHHATCRRPPTRSTDGRGGPAARPSAEASVGASSEVARTQRANTDSRSRAREDSAPRSGDGVAPRGRGHLREGAALLVERECLTPGGHEHHRPSGTGVGARLGRGLSRVRDDIGQHHAGLLGGERSGFCA
jgi:1-deoxy-D-xylulose-5-phosphate synthase